MNFEILYQWQDEIARRIPSLNSWQLENVALFSQGVIYAESSQLERIARQVVCGAKKLAVQCDGYDGFWIIRRLIGQRSLANGGHG